MSQDKKLGLGAQTSRTLALLPTALLWFRKHILHMLYIWHAMRNAAYFVQYYSCEVHCCMYIRRYAVEPLFQVNAVSTLCFSFPAAGIMAILFCGIVMSHYAHHNLSPVTQITIQQILRTVAFMSGWWVGPRQTLAY